MRIKLFSICVAISSYFLIHIVTFFPHSTIALRDGGVHGGSVAGPVPVSDGPKVRKDERWPLVSSQFGEISAVKISDGNNKCYCLHFITMNPRSLFLPVYLRSEMVLYVNTGSGTLSWINVKKDDDKLQQVRLKRGDIYRLSAETVFYIQNNVESSAYQPQKLQIYAIFPGSEVELHIDQFVEVYTGFHDLVLGFDNQLLQSTFSVPEEVIEELRAGEKQPLIVEGQSEPDASSWDVGSWVVRALTGTNNHDILKAENNKKTYNVFKEDHDVETCYGWSVIVTRKELDVLKHTNFGVFMVNLAKGSMMAPHWNPTGVEIGIVLHGQGEIQMVCPSSFADEIECKNSRLMVEEGDVFVVPRYHPMAEISFNNDSFVFMGFMLKQKNESPQYLSGKLSILQRLDRKVLEKSFNAKNTTIDWVLSNKKEDIIYECILCAEEELAMKRKEGGGGGRWRIDKGGRSEEGGGDQTIETRRRLVDG
ncbi:hypothetical protein R6Q59_008139 [Mikania micrantha]